jgi:hypothetical protein
LALGGCVPDKAIQDLLNPAGAAGKMHGVVSVKAAKGKKQLAVSGNYTPQFLTQGTITHNGTRFTGKGAKAVGPLSFQLSKPDPAIQQKFAEFASGNWRSTFDFHGDTATGRATATGTALATFPSTKAGSVCVHVTVRYGNSGKTITNRFQTLGGTGDGATVHARGTYTRTPNPDGSVGVQANVTFRQGKRVSLTKACRRLKS